MGSGEITFRKGSQAVFTYHTGRLVDHRRELRLWGALPISSVRRVIAVQCDLKHGEEDRWLVGVLGKLEFLELLDLGGDCGHVLRRLRHRLARGAISLRINSLVIRGGEYAETQALKFRSNMDVMGLQGTTVTYILDPGTKEGVGVLDVGTSSEDGSDEEEDDYPDENNDDDDDDYDDDDDDDDDEGEDE
jgi:hypothetical protein